MKIAYQGIEGSYSESCAKEMYFDCKTIACKTFDEVFAKADEDEQIRAIVPEMNRISGNIGIENLIFKYRLNIIAEQYYPIHHHLLGLPGAKIEEVKNVYSHAQGLSQCSNFIKKKNFITNVRADTAGSAHMIASQDNKTKAAIASKQSAEIYNLDVLASNIEDEKKNITRFLIFQKKIYQPELEKNQKYITSFLFKLKSKPAALYSALGGMAVNGVNMTKLQSHPEKNSFTSYFFLCDVEGHVNDSRVTRSLEDLSHHVSDFAVIGVYRASSFRYK